LLISLFREFPVHQAECKYTAPLQCPIPGCRNRTRFVALRSSPLTLTVDMQQVGRNPLVNELSPIKFRALKQLLQIWAVLI
jgi:hypothetical protein